MKQRILVFLGALTMMLFMATPALALVGDNPALAASRHISFLVHVGHRGGPFFGHLSFSGGCVSGFGAIDVPGHTSNTSNEFPRPVCLFR